MAASLRGLFLLASPAVLYLAVTRFSVVGAAVVVAGWGALRLGVAMLGRLRGDDLKAALTLPAVAFGSALAGVLTHDSRALLLLPSGTQVAFAISFAATLRAGRMPLVERFARLQKPHLPREEVRYCRRLTAVWAGLMLLGAGLGLALAVHASPAIWAIWAGVGSYAYVGVAFASELAYRVIRFRSPDGGRIARLLYRRWPRTLPADHAPAASPPPQAQP